MSKIPEKFHYIIPVIITAIYHIMSTFNIHFVFI